MNSRPLVCAPRLWQPGSREHRRVTWVELFFDLIFVAAVAEVGHPLAHDYSLEGLLRYGFLFILIWWAWSGHTLYATRFETDDLVERVLMLIQSFIVAVMAANAKDALDSRSSAGFGAAYAAMRLVLVIQYLRARRLPETRQMTTSYALGFGIAAILWIISAFTEPPLRYWLWSLALAVDFLTPWFAAKHVIAIPPDAHHFPERFGLFTIILFGEFVASVMRGIESHEDWSLAAAGTAFAGMAFAFLLRWWYFDGAKSSAPRHITSRSQARLFHLWNYAHLPLFLGIALTGVGFQRAITIATQSPLKQSESLILCAAASLIMFSLIAIQFTSEYRLSKLKVVLQAAIAVLVALSGWYATAISPAFVVLGLLASCGLQVLLVSGRQTSHFGEGNSVSVPASH